MPAVVTPQPLGVGYSGIVSGGAVSPTEWTAIANAYNGLVGMGSALIPVCVPSVTLAADDSFTLRARVWPRYAATHRLWILSTGLDVTPWDFTDPSGGTRTWTSSPVYGRQVTHVETIAARTGAETTLECTVHATLGGVLTSIGCIELPRGFLAIDGELTGHDAGLEPAFIRTGLPITDDYSGNGIGFIAREMRSLRDTVRRTGVWAWFSGDDGEWATSSSSFVKVAGTTGAYPAALVRQLFNGQTLGTLQLAAYAYATSGGGEIRWTMASGAVVTAAVPIGGSSAPALIRTQIEVDCEDLAASDGRRSSRDDFCTIEARAVGGGEVRIQSLTAGEGASADPTGTGNAARLGRRLPPRFLFGGKASR